MKISILILVLLSSFNLYSQNSRDEFDVFLLPQGYSVKLLSSTGTSSIINNISNLGFMNPASISGFDNYTTGLSYQLSSSIDEAYVLSIGSSRIHNWYPQSFGGIVKWNNFTLGLGFGQKYNGTLDFGKIPVTTSSNPDGTGEFIEPVMESTIHTYSITAAYSLQELLQTNDNLSLGIRFNLNRFHQKEELDKLNIKATTLFSNVTIGLLYDLIYSDYRRLKLGLSYESNSKFKAEIEVHSQKLAPQIDSLPPTNLNPVKIYYTGETPAELRFDLAADITTNFLLYSNLTTVFWKTSNNNLKDQIEFSTGVTFNISEKFSTGIGIYYSDRKYEEDLFRLNSKFEVLFLTTGLKYSLKFFYIDLSIADSHLISGEFRKQTIGKIGLGVIF
jgi:long-subunit fatty acid transport protein